MEIIASHDLDALSTELAATLRPSTGDVQSRLVRAFDAEVVVVPSSHMRRYLQRSLACHLGSTGANDGIVANIEFLQPRQLVYASTGDVPTWQNVRRIFGIGDNPWDADHLTWIIDDAIRSTGLVVPSHGSSPLTTSRRIAELFDHYTTHRPEMLRQWRDGDDTDGALLAGSLDPSHLWQRDLYRAVSERLAPVVTLAALHLDEWDAHLATARQVGVLPDRLSVFGVTGLSHAVRDILRVLDRHMQVTIYSVHAAMSAWPTLAPQPNETRESWHLRLAAEHEAEGAHPLHGRWCSHSVEQAVLLGSPTTALPGNPVQRSTLLGAIRADIVENVPKALPLMTDDALDAALNGGDGTIQVHTCYGSLRQAEALRDALLRTLRDTPDLRLRDITVVVADPQKAAPILNAVFDPGVDSQDGQALPRLPINVVGADSGQLDPLAEAFMALLLLASSRCSVAEVIEVLSLPPVSATFGLDNSSLEAIATWAETSGVRHGINPEHRAGVTGVPLDLLAATWSDALARIAAGIAVPAAVDVVGPGGVVPYDAVTSGDIITFGALAEFLDRLSHLAALVTPDSTMTRSSWVSTALGIVDSFLTVSSIDTESMVALRSNIARLAPGSTGELDATYPVRELVAATESLMSHEFSPYSRPWESITVTSLDGLAHRPTRVVAIFGANEDMFAGPATDGDNVLSSTPLVGEPNYSMAARQGMLHAIVCATDAVIITCDGADVSNNKETPPAIALREFLELVAATIDDASPFGNHRVLAAHPRQNHHLDELTVDTYVPGEAFTFDPTAVEAQRVVGRSVINPPSAVSPAAPAPSGSVTPLGAVVRAIRNPIEYHLRDVLGVELPPEQGDDSQEGRHHIDGDGIIALTVDALALSAEGRRLLTRVVSDTADEDD
ncbi:MAG: exodeoxyribonuclease V subunit gamma, partial [Ilumatobacteraceae bacterium]